MGQWMQETLYQTGDAGDTLWVSGSSSFSIRDQVQQVLYQTADAGDTLWDSRSRRHSM